MATQTQGKFFEAVDGKRLFARWQPAPTAPLRGGALVVHGYADHSGRYDEVGARLRTLGFHTMAFDYRGHGEASGQRGHCHDFAEYLSDLDRALAALRHGMGAAQKAPILLVAHSHGSLIALRALCDPSRPLAGVTAAVLSSPFLAVGMKVSPIKLLVGKLASRIAPKLSMPNGIDATLLTHDREILAVTQRDDLRHQVATARWFTEALAAQEYVQANAARITVPTLWLIGDDDRIADPAAMRRAYARAGGAKLAHEYRAFYHELFNETGREQVFKDIESWIPPLFPVVA